METILAKLLVIELIRFQLVSRRSRAIIDSETFQSAFREVGGRSPWFLMGNEDNIINSIYDIESGIWIQRELTIPNGTIYLNTSGYFMCSVSREGTISAGNPFTGPTVPLHGYVFDKYHEAIAILVINGKFFVFAILRNVQGLAVMIYSSNAQAWREIQLILQQGVGEPMDIDIPNYEWPSHLESSGLTTVNNEGDVMVYYVVRGYKLVKCDINHCIAYEYPFIDILEGESYEFALVELGGRIFMVSLMEYFDTDDDDDDDESEHSDGECKYFGVLYDDEIELEVLDCGVGPGFFKMILRLYEFKDDVEEWALVSKKTVALTGGLSDATPTINCSGKGNYIMVCFHSKEYVMLDQVVKYNILGDNLEKLPRCIDNATGEVKKLVSTFSISPDIKFLV